MSPRFFLLRHGRSVANERRLIASDPANARDAFGLTPTGRDQVSASIAGAREAGQLASPVALISSPLLRARESADVAASRLDASARVDVRLTERGFGDLELETDDAYERVWARDRADASHSFFGVEPVVDVLARARAVVVEASADPASATVVLCTHGDVASTLLCAAQGFPLERHREVGAMETGALRELRFARALLDGPGASTP